MGSCKGRAFRGEGSAKALRQDRLGLFRSQKENLAAEGGVGRTTEMSLVAPAKCWGCALSRKAGLQGVLSRGRLLVFNSGWDWQASKQDSDTRRRGVCSTHWHLPG